MTTFEKMYGGKIYTDSGDGLPERRLQCKELVYDFNHSRPREEQKRREILKQLLGGMGDNVWIEPPVHFVYGDHIHIGSGVFMNFNLVILDDLDVYIGDNVKIGPNVTITTTGHPVHPELRKNGAQISFPVTIKENVWIGSNAVILPGITIGKNSVIGAGSIVTKDIPEDVVAVGNPCRVLRLITEKDKKRYDKALTVEDL